ncbi:MAG: GNAT family N-acetyltransferase [Ardenticatenaceae bacterium]|nr:GNAT family N-acetyltransferase [Ardenticatenaceae bacterium]
MTTPITHRPAAHEADYWAVHRLLVDHVRDTPLGFNLDIRRWEGRRFYDARPGGDPSWGQQVQLWETANGQLVGTVLPIEPGEAALQLAPAYGYLEEEMLTWAEAYLSKPTADGNGRLLQLLVYENNPDRESLLASHGYEKSASGGVLRQMAIRLHESPTVAEGYTIRSTQPECLTDCQRVADVLNAAFGRTGHTAVEYQWFTRQAPSFRAYLDLAAVAPDGTFAAYAGIPYDAVNRRGIFEPVCTHPAHQRRGLGIALMQEGLHRLAQLGAEDVIVETGQAVAANALYNSLGFDQTVAGFYWRKIF